MHGSTPLLLGVVALLALLVTAAVRLRRTDRRTGLANRRGVRTVARTALARGPRATAILILDMTGADDREVVARFTEVLRLSVPARALPGRLSDDRFAVVLTEVDHPGQAYDAAGRIAAALGQVAVNGRLITLAAAIGVAVAQPGELTYDELADRAERAMLRAKSLGPDTRWAIWRTEPETGGSALPAAA